MESPSRFEANRRSDVMKFEPSKIEGAWIVEGVRHGDDRGWFQELFKQSVIERETGFRFAPVQINVSHSTAGVIRGVHYSIAPHGQAKYVTVLSGAVDDYIIDIRPASPTFGTWQRVRLDSAQGNAVLLGPHMGHAFQAVSPEATVSYAVTAEFNPDAEKAINPMCPRLAIEWDPSASPIISPKDHAAAGLLEQLENGLLP